MRLVYHADFLNILGWSLFDSCWQMGVLWLFYCVLTANGKRLSAATRYLLAVLTVAGGCIWFLGSVILHSYSVRAGSPSYFSGLLPDYGFLRTVIPAYVPALISLVYLLTLILLCGRLLYHYQATKKLYTQNLQPASNQFRTCLAALQQQLDVATKISLRFSEKVVTPLTTGFIKPIVLLPLAAINRLSTQQVEALIAHELCHIKRNDYLINLGLSIAGQLFFFNPFTRLLINIAQKEREASCDDKVLALGYASYDYAEALYVIGKNENEAAGRLAMAATGMDGKALLHRIRRILRQPVAAAPLSRPLLFFGLILAVAIGSGKRTSLSTAIPPLTTTGEQPLSAQVVTARLAEAAAGYHVTGPTAQLTEAATAQQTEAAITPLTERTTGNHFIPAPAKDSSAASAPNGGSETSASSSIIADAPTAVYQAESALPAVTSYVHGIPVTVEFSILEKKVIVPEMSPVGRPLPYVPASTFYYPEPAPEVDSTDQRSIRL